MESRGNLKKTDFCRKQVISDSNSLQVTSFALKWLLHPVHQLISIEIINQRDWEGKVDLEIEFPSKFSASSRSHKK